MEIVYTCCMTSIASIKTLRNPPNCDKWSTIVSSSIIHSQKIKTHTERHKIHTHTHTIGSFPPFSTWNTGEAYLQFGNKILNQQENLIRRIYIRRWSSYEIERARGQLNFDRMSVKSWLCIMTPLMLKEIHILIRFQSLARLVHDSRESPT